MYFYRNRLLLKLLSMHKVVLNKGTVIWCAKKSVYFSPQITAEREKELRKQQEEKEQTSITLKKTKEEQTPKTFKAGIGKYINPATM